MLNTSSDQGNTNQNHKGLSSHTRQNGYHLKDKKYSLARMRSRRKPCALLVGMQLVQPLLEGSTEVPQKVKNRTIT